MNKTTIILTSLLLTSCHAVNPPQAPQYDRYAKQIVFRADPENHHNTKDHGAVAMYVHETPFVFYNPAWFSSMPEEAQTFFFQHEVAHFRLKHLDSYASASVKQRMRFEMQADCHSMLYLQNRLQYAPAQFERIYDHASFHIEEERAKNLLNCLTLK
ncbi:MAG: hypothetical protein Q7S55_03340 [Nanoarchaeota archaeon]|nr:hypothetical protein [Nanoarchaeota archaeon]